MPANELHGDVIAGLSAYDEVDREVVGPELADFQQVRRRQLPAAMSRYAWSEDEGHEFTPGKLRRLREVAVRPDAEVRRDVLRMLTLDRFVPMTVNVQVSDGIVRLNGAFASEREREDASYLAGLVPGVFGVVDQPSGQSYSNADYAGIEAFA